MTPKNALEKAVDVCGGSALKMAQKIGGKVVRQNVDYWLKSGSVPAEHCPAIERVTRAIAAEKGDAGLVVTCEELCPSVPWEVLREQAA